MIAFLLREHKPRHEQGRQFLLTAEDNYLRKKGKQNNRKRKCTAVSKLTPLHNKFKNKLFKKIIIYIYKNKKRKGKKDRNISCLEPRDFQVGRSLPLADIFYGECQGRTMAGNSVGVRHPRQRWRWKSFLPSCEPCWSYLGQSKPWYEQIKLNIIYFTAVIYN